MPKIFQLIIFLVFVVFVKAQNKTSPRAQKAKMDSTTAAFFKEIQLSSQSQSIIKSPHVDSLVEKYRKAKMAVNKTHKADYVYVFDPIKLSDTDFNHLSPKDKFVYAFKYPEKYTQNCSSYFFDGSSIPFLHASLPFITEGITTSERQSRSLLAFRNISIIYLIEIIQKALLIDNAYKNAIVELKAFECIPTLMHKYKTSKVKDNYILTTGLLLMKDDSFPPFLSSVIYQRFYKENGHWRDKMDLTEAVKTTTIDLIDKYYKWKTGK